MLDQLSFILKLLISSAAIAIAIKYGGPFLAIQPTVFNVLIAILLPTIVLGFALGWRTQHSPPPN